MNYLILFIFGFLPSVIWLSYYLKKDNKPEPKLMLLKTFIYGMLVAVPVAILEIAILKTFNFLFLPGFFLTILNIFIGVALIEEIMKYFVVRQKVINNPAFDEPVDAMIYMLVAGLGFAAVENILILLYLSSLFEIFVISSARFLGATFLHALCCANIGYFLALRIFYKKSQKLFILGLCISILLHGIYNYSIIEIQGSFKFIIPIILLITLSMVVAYEFKKLKTCKV